MTASELAELIEKIASENKSKKIIKWYLAEIPVHEYERIRRFSFRGMIKFYYVIELRKNKVTRFGYAYRYIVMEVNGVAKTKRITRELNFSCFERKSRFSANPPVRDCERLTTILKSQLEEAYQSWIIRRKSQKKLV